MVIYLGSLVQLCCGEGGTLQTNITGVCRECSQCMDHTGFAPAHGLCAFPVYSAQDPSGSAGKLSKVGPGFCALPRSKLLRFLGAPQGHRPRLAVHFVLISGPSSSGDRVLGACTVPGGLCVLFTHPVPATRLPRRTMRAQS